jgi:hypothetical protein
MLLLASAAFADEHEGERGSARAGLQLYIQPAAGDALVVVTPSASAQVAVTSWLSFDVDWLADVVTGATPRTYGPPDAISAATSFTEVRNLLGAGAQVRWRMLTFTAGYRYGIENDYRSQLVHGAVKADLFQHNTQLQASYSHGFDAICDLAQAGVPVTLRQPLDQSKGCFAGTPGLTEESLSIDAAELSWVQTISRAWVGALVGSYEHLSGFQSNPYRRVRLSGGTFQAQESHPRRRDRGALTGRLRYALEKEHAVVGLDLRLYRDTWDVQSITGEATWQQPFRPSQPEWRYLVLARGYVQSGAVFYRDAGNADAYDRTGPVGSYFTADQALAPLANLLVGGHVSWAGRRDSGRYLAAFTSMETSLSLDWMRIFALSPNPPNVQRTQGWASAILVGLSASGWF